jgi:hypothetical protein
MKGRAAAAAYRLRPRLHRTVPRVTVIVRGGVAEVLSQPPGVEVTIIDYDVDASASAGLDRDAAGHACTIQNNPVHPPA